jgi:hypothetical protein
MALQVIGRESKIFRKKDMRPLQDRAASWEGAGHMHQSETQAGAGIGSP